jgi:formiminoglutamase
MDISFYFRPVPGHFTEDLDKENYSMMWRKMDIFSEDKPFPDIDSKYDIALLGVTEERNATGNKGCAEAPDHVRPWLYKLIAPAGKFRIADLGNIRSGNRPEDTYFALRDAAGELLRRGTIPFIIGGSQDLSFANYLAYQSLGKIINIAVVDNRFDLGRDEKTLRSDTYLSPIITYQPNYLFNLTNLGYQTYFVENEVLELMKNLYFDASRLGQMQADMEEAEPMVRNADMLSFDISAIRASDAPGCARATPHGFYGEEACRIMRYAGISDKMSSAGIYEINPSFDRNGQTAQLAAQLVWHFIEGFACRKNDIPARDKNEYIRYRVAIRELTDEIVFYKSKKSGRWWMEVPCPGALMTKYERHYMVPCSYNDYKTACRDDIPDRWWQACQKIM